MGRGFKQVNPLTSMEKEQNINDILTNLDNKSRKARYLSLLITGLTMVIGASIIIGLLYIANKELDTLKKQKDLITKDIQLLQEQKSNVANNLQNGTGNCEEKISEAVTALKSEPIPVNSVQPPLTPTPTPKPTPQPTVKGKRTVYVQFADCSQLAKVKERVSALSANYTFPGFDCRGGKLKGRIPETQVKYFLDNDGLAAEALADELKKQQIAVKVVHAKGNSPILEIWFSEDFLPPVKYE